MLGILPPFFFFNKLHTDIQEDKKTTYPTLSKQESMHIRQKCFKMYGLVQSIIKIYGALPTPRIWSAPALLHIYGLVKEEQHRLCHREVWCDGQRPRWTADTKGPRRQSKYHFLTYINTNSLLLAPRDVTFTRVENSDSNTGCTVCKTDLFALTQFESPTVLLLGLSSAQTKSTHITYSVNGGIRRTITKM